MSFLLEKCTFYILDKEVLDDCDSFICGYDDLDDFFTNDSCLYSQQLLGKSYCFRLDENPSIIVCAFTVSNDSIRTSVLPNARRGKVTKKIPHIKQMRRYPAVLIGRLGMNESYKRKGIGTDLMDFIKSWFVDKNNKTGCRYVVVDSYNEVAPKKYYTKNGFDFVYSTEEQEAEGLQNQIQPPLKTRLMYFDLITLKNDPID